MTDRMMKAPESGVKVRMYRQGLGDCFLLAFPANKAPAKKTPAKKAGETFYMLIDCGVLMGTPDAAEQMKAVASSIKDSTCGKIDLVVISHEHYDHLSGFGFEGSQQIFKDFTFGQVWVPWVADKTDGQALKLRKDMEMQLHALEITARLMKASGNEKSAAAINELLGVSKKVQEQLQFVLDKKRARAQLYPKPSLKPLTLDNAPGARFYVLGPPTDEKLLHQMDASRDGEIYELARKKRMALVNAVLSLEDKAKTEETGKFLPFDPGLEISEANAKGDEFFRANYGFGSSPGQGAEWRRIDADWLMAMEELALAYDHFLNNTSLALAIELTKSGKVLIFPGDAQVGNILSWSQLKKEEDEDGHSSMDELFKRTVFYKVGHHGSHNATLKEKELEKMASKELAAMIPVNQEMARKKKWNMPFPHLLDALKEKTRGRVIILDQDLPKNRPQELSQKEWTDFKNNVTETEHYFEYTVNG